VHISFVLDPLVPSGIRKVVREVVRSLQGIFEEVTFSSEVDERLLQKQPQGILHSNKIFGQKHISGRHRYTVYLVSGKLFSRKNAVCGVALRSVGIVSLFDISHSNYDLWSAGVWEVLLHELGHCFGLVQKRKRATSRSKTGTLHCTNSCVMSDDALFSSLWQRNAAERRRLKKPYCSLCHEYLRQKKEM
jgi:predicted Zn-dependent protease